MSADAAMEVRAAVFREPGLPVAVETLRLEPPRAGELLVRVAAAGVCHSDLHLASGHLGSGRWPIVLGHEGAGIVEQVGPGVTHVAPGDRVAFCFVPPCYRCPSCRGGRFHMCELAGACALAGTLTTGGRRLRFPDGGEVQHFLCVSCFAERCVVPAGAALPLPDGVPLWQAALLGCAVVTGVGAVRNTARVRLGDRVAVVGCGGVGLQVIAGARLAGAVRIVAVDRSPDKLERALRQGATDAVDASTGDPVRAVRTLVGGGVDHAFEVVGTPETVRAAWEMLRSGGTATVIGLVPKGVDVSLPGLDLSTEKRLQGSYYGSANVAVELPVLAGLAASGRLNLSEAVSHFAGLDGVEEAFDRMRAGEGARTVLMIAEGAAGARNGGG